LISLGTTDPGGITADILSKVLDAAPASTIDVVLGPQAKSIDRVQQLSREDRRVTFHVSSTRMAELMCNSDLGVGAAGMTSWERCCLGLPSIVLVMAENQRLGATALASAGAALIVHDTDEIGSALRELLLDPIRLSRMSAAAFAITDGGGARRSVTALLGENDETANVFALRPANADDAELLWLWRNDPTTRTQSRNTDPIAWRDHSRWFAETLAIPSTRLMIADRNGTPAGMIRFDRLDDGEGVQVNISVAPDLRGRGVGRAMLVAACAGVEGQVMASVREDNERSRRLFERCGFTPDDPAEPGYVRYVLRQIRSDRTQA
jgi:RimJ/RimL family protein N-acetyltransferase